MKIISIFVTKLRRALYNVVSDEPGRIRLQYIAIYTILCYISVIMTVVNVFTAKWALMFATLTFSLLCGLNYLLARKSEKWLKAASVLFRIEILVLISFFIITGSPEGFSAIWAALLPACGLLVFKARRGTEVCAAMLAIILFFFWTPLGQSFLRYDYTQSFRLRFPFLFIAFYAVGLFLETVRAATFDNYSFMCTHDPLTGALNRRGLDEHVRQTLHKTESGEVGFMIFDLDHFKLFNDTYGHHAGDEVLKTAHARLAELTGLPICRLGGEEFAVFVPDGRLSKETVDRFARDFAAEPFSVDGLTLTVSISLGAVTAPLTEPFALDRLAIEADNCMYAAKEAGRARGVFKRLEA